MILKHIKSDVYNFIAGNYLNIFLTEKELIDLLIENDIADIQKTPIGYLCYHDVGIIPVRHYFPLMSEGAKELLAISLSKLI